MVQILGGRSYQTVCNDEHSLVRSFNASANEGGVTVDGAFDSDQHNCITDRREVFEGSLNYAKTDAGLTQSSLNLSYRREQYRGSESVFGYFVGLYRSQSDVTSTATGEIRGLGLNAGVYGAKRLQSELFLDYYLGAAVGRHKFDLAFDRSIGSISATGDYQYFAGFAGAALSGEFDLGEATITPRIGFDYVYAPSADVDVLAELGVVSEVGELELEAISGGRIFAEIRSAQDIWDGQANLWINPRVACYQSLGSFDGVCGFGGAIGIESTDEDSDLTFAFEIDGEWGSGYTLGSIKAGVTHQLGLGEISSDAGIDTNGNAHVGAAFEVQF